MSFSLFKNEKFEEGKGPSIQDLLKEEVVDILPYIGWEEKIEDKQKREQVSGNFALRLLLVDVRNNLQELSYRVSSCQLFQDTDCCGSMRRLKALPLASARH